MYTKIWTASQYSTAILAHLSDVATIHEVNFSSLGILYCVCGGYRKHTEKLQFWTYSLHSHNKTNQNHSAQYLLVRSLYQPHGIRNCSCCQNVVPWMIPSLWSCLASSLSNPWKISTSESTQHHFNLTQKCASTHPMLNNAWNSMALPAGSQISPAYLSDNSNIRMKMSMQHW